MRIIALILVLLSPVVLSAATVSGEASIKKSILVKKITPPKITYYT
jgi:hypothetical protein